MNRFFKLIKYNIHYPMKILILILKLSYFYFHLIVRAEYEMHIPNCTQKGVENCGGFYLIMKLVMFYFVDQRAVLI